MRYIILGYVHGSPTTGHFGVARTCKRLKEHFWKHDLRTDVSAYVSKCLICEMYRASKPSRQGNMQVYHPSRRFEIVAVDILQISPKSRNGNKKVVVIGTFLLLVL